MGRSPLKQLFGRPWQQRIRNLSVIKPVFTRNFRTDVRISVPSDEPENRGWSMWSTPKNEVFWRFLTNKWLLNDAWRSLVNVDNVVNEKWKGCKEKNEDEFLLVITDNVRVIGVLGGVRLGPESASETSMGAVGLEPTKS